MGSRDIPSWLAPAFVRSVQAVGGTAPTSRIDEAARSLLERWTTGERHFHDLRHLKDTLARADELAPETHHPDVVRLAVWYHGAVFSTTAVKAYRRAAGEDKEASAQFAVEQLTDLGVPQEVADRVAFLILNLKRHDADPQDIDAQAVCDAELGTIAAEPQKYRVYRDLVSREFAHLPRRHYVEAREKLVTRLLERRHIFRSPLAQAWEPRARENLTAELARLRAELARMGQCGAEDHLPGSPEHEAEDARRAAPPVRRSIADRVPGMDTQGPETSTGVVRVRRTGPLGLGPRTASFEAVPTVDRGAQDGRATGAEGPAAPATPGSSRPEHPEPAAEDHEPGTERPDADTRSTLESGPEALFASLSEESQRRRGPRPAAVARAEQRHLADQAEARRASAEEGVRTDVVDDTAPEPATQDVPLGAPREEQELRERRGEEAAEDHRSGIERDPDLFSRRRRRFG